ncbi:glycoside hydrolase family 32 protein [Priestia aryabhattai]|uniref:glycoside hydrolase family 32 protein n=1 Tax=Priestia megaterium TaxID=1404 RepID=UPI003F993F1C
MTEKYRPKFHITPEREWMNDLQRPLYINGEHHLYYLWNEDYSWGGNGTEWAHVTSTDLIHWNRKPVAIEKYQTPAGDPWTGSCVKDYDNTAGFGYGAIIALVTMPPETNSTHLWYSKDDGNSFTYHGIVQHNPTGQADFRDPKIIWHEPTGKWIMLLAEKYKVAFYTSSNLRDWTYTSSFVPSEDIGIIECPDIFEINVDGNPSSKKWVLAVGGNGFMFGLTTGTFYYVGDFDGKDFHSETSVQWLEYGADSYAGVTWDAPYCEGNYRYFASWMSNWEYATKVPWETHIGNTSIVRELRLVTSSSGLKLIQSPVWNLLPSLREIQFLEGATIYKNQENILKNIRETSYSIEAKIDVADLTSGKFGFALRDGNGEHTDLTYDKVTHELVFDRSSSGFTELGEIFNRQQKVKVEPKEGKVKLVILVDNSTVEIFVNDGEYVLSNIIFPQLSSDGLRLWTDDHVHLEYLRVRRAEEEYIL